MKEMTIILGLIALMILSTMQYQNAIKLKKDNAVLKQEISEQQEELINQNEFIKYRDELNELLLATIQCYLDSYPDGVENSCDHEHQGKMMRIRVKKNQYEYSWQGGEE